jgi:hypothetical protein
MPTCAKTQKRSDNIFLLKLHTFVSMYCLFYAGQTLQYLQFLGSILCVFVGLPFQGCSIPNFGLQKLNRAAIQRRGSILAWIVILSFYGVDTIAIDLSLSALISWFMKSIIGFLSNSNLHAIISILLIINLHYHRRRRFCHVGD